MSLKGSLNSVDLANIFQMLSINQKEGTLNIFDGHSKKSIYFSADGVSMLSRGRPNRDLLGRILMRFDQLSHARLEQALGIQKRTGQLLGVVLEENEILPRTVIEDALRIQIEEEIYNLFIWKDAEFEFIEGAQPREFEQHDGAVRKLTFNVNSLIMEAARRIDEWTHISAVVKCVEDVYRYTGENVELADPIFQEPYSDKVLACIDGKRNVDEVIEGSFVNKFEVYKIVCLLFEQGAVEATTPEDLNTGAETAISEGDLETGIKFLNRVIDLGRDTSDTHRAIADAYQAVKEPRKAAQHFRKYAETRLLDGEPEVAFQVYRRICELLPTDLQASERVVELYADYRDSLKNETSEVIERGSALAAMFIEVGQRDRATAVLKRLVELAPEDFSIRHLLIKVFLDDRRSEEALAQYQGMLDWFTKKKKWAEQGQIIRKMLAIEPGREDLKQRLEQVLTRKEKRRRNLRRFGWVGLLTVVFSIAGYAYLRYNQDAREEIGQAESRSSASLLRFRADLESTDEELDAVARALHEGASNVPAIVETFRKAEQLQLRCQALIGQNVRELREIAERYKYSTERGAVTNTLSEWQEIGSILEKKLEDLRGAMHARARELAKSAQAHNDDGRITPALQLFRSASLMAVGKLAGEKELASELARNVEILEERLQDIEAGLGRIGALIEEEKIPEARDAGILLIRENFDLSEVLQRTPVPLRVESEPPGATVRLNDRTMEQRTPCWVDWRPGMDTDLILEVPGFLPTTHQLPGLDVLSLDSELQRVAALTKVVRHLFREPVWSGELGSTIQAEAAATGSNAYLATRNARIHKLDAANHVLEQIHQAESFEGIASGPCLRDGSLFLATIEGRLERMDPRTGVRRWRHQVPGRIYAPIIVTAGKVIVGDSGGYISAHDANTGALLWRRPVSGEVLSRPVVSGDRVFVTTSNGKLYVHSLIGGRRQDVLSPSDPGDRFIGSPALGGGRIYVCGSRGSLTAFEIPSGRRIWTAKTEGELRAGPVLIGDVLVVGSMDGHLYAIRAGSILDRQDLGGPIVAAPIVVDGVVYVSNDTGLVLAADCVGGRLHPRWRVDLSKATENQVRVAAPPASVGARILVTSETGELFLLSK